MIDIKPAKVKKLIWERKGIQGLEVEIEGKKEKALNYTFLTGTVLKGQIVILNTTAGSLKLGSGGYHFVIFNYSKPSLGLTPGGHIIKLRYTPFQMKVNTYEEQYYSRQITAFEKYKGLNNIPVVTGELHSMLAPFTIILKNLLPGLKIVYIMPDSAALPLYLSNTVHFLKTSGMIHGTVTCGHAFGGDLETVNLFTALIAAKEKLNADVIIITPGPGVVGTATRYGNSGVEQGEHVDKTFKLQGIPVAIPRISFADFRKRHYGLSHHTMTALGELSFAGALFPLPSLDKEKMNILHQQLINSGINNKHEIIIVKVRGLMKRLLKKNCLLRTMGRGLKEDPSFFASIAAAAYVTAKNF